MPPNPPDPELRIMDALRRVVRALSTSARNAPGAGPISGAQRFVLRQIGDRPGLSIRQLAALTHARQSAVSEVVARLVDQGLVTRAVSVSDGRQAELTLTAAGRQAIAEAEPTAQERLGAGLAILTADDRAALAAGLERWLTAAGFADVPPTMFFEASGGAATAGEDA
jgi:DNA-binding MarR family transcriptional regulator